MARRHIERVQERYRIVRSHPTDIAMGDEEGQQRVPATGEGDADRAEYWILLKVVAYSDRQRLENLLEKLLTRRWPRRGFGEEVGAVGRHRVGQRGATRSSAELG